MSSQPMHVAGRSAGTGFGVVAATALLAVGSIAFVFICDTSVAAEPVLRSSGSTRPGLARPLATPNAKRESTARHDALPPAPPSRYPPPPIARFEPRRLLGPADEIAALEAVQIALSEVGDGASYVWHRDHGRLSGVVKPTHSYFDAAGHVCRHVHVLLTSGDYTRRAEGVACRDETGIWSLDG
ncbi:MAG: hypothetical protein R3D27_14400 [Hyphomicrobiaceae bacterium]